MRVTFGWMIAVVLIIILVGPSALIGMGVFTHHEQVTTGVQR